MILAVAFTLLFTPIQQQSPALAELGRQAAAMTPLVESDLAKEWLRGAAKLPSPTPRTLHRRDRYLTQSEFDALADDAKAKVKSRAVDDELYYNTKYGTPIAYSRPVDLAAKFGLKSFEHSKVMDFGYGGIGQLRLFALLGADAVGVDVDPFLAALYSLPEDKGSFGPGSVTHVIKRFPSEAGALGAVGQGYDLVISKNTLKRGYIHPERSADKRMLIDLGVSDEKFLGALHEAMNPGSLFVIYNLCPAPAPLDKPYIPWADGRSPFGKTQFEEAGFEVLAIDINDDGPVRAMAHALGWDQGEQPMDTQKDLFAWYTVVRRR